MRFSLCGRARFLLSLFGFTASLLAGLPGCQSSSDEELLVEPATSPTPGAPLPDGKGVAEGQPTPVFSNASSGKGHIPPPLDRDTEGVVLPLPESTTLMGMRSFMDEYRDAYLKLMPLAPDYRVYFSAVTVNGGGEPEALEIVKARVREDFEKGHWIFLYGTLELMEYLAGAAKGSLMQDREENFVARMKTVSFLGNALSEISGEQKYRDFARDVYIALSKKHFGRNVRIRNPGK